MSLPQVLGKEGKANMDPKSQRSKDEISHALLQLMKSKDFAAITNKVITDAAQLSHITYYRNFSSKEDIIRFHLHRVTDHFIAVSQIDYETEDFQAYLIKLFTHLMNQKELGELLLRAGLIHCIKEEFDRIFSAKAKDRRDLFHYYFIAGGLYNLYYVWLKNGCRETPEELAALFMDFSISKKS